VVLGGVFLIYLGKTNPNHVKKKRHARVKKGIFRLETRFFSSSIRFANGMNAGMQVPTGG
jgi:hypothetical protein